jgi:steroid delta-isomerase-like uncharacterized protein
MALSTRQVVAELLQAWNAHDVERIVALHAPDYEGMDVAWPGPRRGRDGVRRGWGRYLAAFPDLQFAAETVIVQGNRAAVSWTALGTHRGALMNIPPTGRAVRVRGISVLHVEQGQVTRALHVWDVAGLLRTIGLLPEL